MTGDFSGITDVRQRRADTRDTPRGTPQGLTFIGHTDKTIPMTETPPGITTTDLIRAAMALRGYMQRDLAEALNLAQNTISEKLSGSYDWRLSELRRVSAWLKVDIADLVTTEPEFAAIVPTTQPATAAAS